MDTILNLLYEWSYTPLELDKLNEIVGDCHRQLTERLDKPERKLLLKLIDVQAEILDETSQDSFLCGFKLALELTSALKHYDGHLCGVDADRDARHLLDDQI